MYLLGMAAGPYPPAPPEDYDEQVRRHRLREDGRRPLAVNLAEAIALTGKLFELREAMLEARERSALR